MSATVSCTVHPGPAPVAAMLRAARIQQGLTLRAVSDGVEGISAATLCRVENGERSLSGPKLLALGDRLGIPRDELDELSGGLTHEGMDELLSGDVALCLRAGRLLPEAVNALRSCHLGQLAGRSGGATLDELSYSVGLDFRIVGTVPGFELDTEYYRVPLGLSDDVCRMWQAHGLAHAVLADASGSSRACLPIDATAPIERDANVLARHLLVPTASLRSAHRALGTPEPHDPRELFGLVSALARTLAAPAGWIAARLADEGLLGAAA